MTDYAVQHIVWIWILYYIGHVALEVDIPSMERMIRFRFSKVRNHFVDPNAKDQAREFIYEEFRRLGLATEPNNFVHVDVDQDLSGEFGNVIGVIKGTRFGKIEDRFIVIGAHFDTVKTSNGVDDNGAGVAAMLEVARQLTQMKATWNNTIIFVAFDLGEYGQIGSEKFISTWVRPWLTNLFGVYAKFARPHGVIVLDTVLNYNTSEFSQNLPITEIMKENFLQVYNNIQSDSFRGDFLALSYRAGSEDAPLAEAFKEAWTASRRHQFLLESLPFAGLSLSEAEGYGPLLGNSDHLSFWEEELPAIFLTDSGYYRGNMQRCYHQMCDDVDTMLTDENLQFLGKTADAITMTVNRLSEPVKDHNPSGVGRPACSKVVLVLVLMSIVAKTS